MTAAPQPKGLPLIGNLREIDPENTTMSLLRLADTYGNERLWRTSCALTDMVH